MKLHFILICFAAILSFQPTAYGQRSGIRGEVFWVGGNQMPGPGRTVAPKLGIQREIHIHKVTTVENENQHGPFFTDIKSDLITTLQSRNDGSFKVKLPPGEYSVFVKEPQGMFANLINSDGKINPVKVLTKRFSWLTITVDYEAAY